MYPKFPGLNNSMLEEKVNDIENSITSSLLDNSYDRNKCVFNPFYIIGFILIGGCASSFTYVCIKFLS